MVNRQHGLGRGLGALLSSSPAPSTGQDAIPGPVVELPIDSISANPKQPRKDFDDKALHDLSESLKQSGLLQPVVVRRFGEAYQLVVGERRWRAAKMAGITRIPAVIRDATDAETLELALVENLLREDLNPMEEALAYHQLHEDFGLTQEEIAQRVGKERSTVANFLRLIKLPEVVKKLLASGQLSMGHARALLAVESTKKQEQLAARVVKRNLNVRQTEVLAAGPKAEKKSEKEKDVFTRDAEEKLQRTLRTKVAIDRKRRGGVIHIRFGSEDELIRVVDDLMGRRR